MTMLTSFTEMNRYADDGLNFADYTSIFIAAVPFLMVAVVEATKIPFVEAYYRTTRLIWKVVFGLSLLFIALITFESAINGFERNFNALMYGVDKHKKELVNVEEQIPPLKEQREKLSNLSSEQIEKTYSEKNAKVSQQRQEQILIIQDRIQSLRASIRTEFVTSLRDQAIEKKKELELIYKDRDNALASLKAENAKTIENASLELSTQRRTLQTQLSQAQDRLSNMEKRAQQEIDDASIFTTNSVEKRWQAYLSKEQQIIVALRADLNSLSASDQNRQIRENYRGEVEAIRNDAQLRADKLNSEINDLNLQISKSVSGREKDIENLVQKHQEELKDAELLFFKQQEENKDARTRDFVKLESNEQALAELDKSILLLEKQRVELRNDINIKVGDNQIYRIAQWFWGRESAADINRKEVALVASIWFGSLALLIAFTGIILALASLVISDSTIPDRGEKRRNMPLSSLSKLINTFRRWLYYSRKMKRQPIYKTVVKEVVKEIPVDKVVFKDKPIEIIKREIVHVPLYTDDKTLINLSNKGSFGQKELES